MLRTCTVFALIAFAAPALADTHITYVDDSGQPATQIFVKGGKVRMEGGRGVALYDSSSNSLTMLMPERKQYLVMDEQSTAQMGASMNAAEQQAQSAMAAHQAQMDQASQQLQAAMANMTPEQKAAMQQAMSAQGGPGRGAGPVSGEVQAELKDLNHSESVAGHKCADMQVMMNGRPGPTLCMFSGSPSALGIPAADVKTLEAMRDGMKKLQSRLGPMAQGMAAMMGKGFSLKTTHQTYRDMQAATETDTFKGVSTAGLDAALFEIPAGYTQTTLQEMMQQGHP